MITLDIWELELSLTTGLFRVVISRSIRPNPPVFMCLNGMCESAKRCISAINSKQEENEEIGEEGLTSLR